MASAIQEKIQQLKSRVQTGPVGQFFAWWIEELRLALPDDTHLTRLVIGKTNVQLQGQSENAQQLIELVNDSDYMEAAAFRGSTRLDARTGLEIFEISAQITNPSGGANVAGS